MILLRVVLRSDGQKIFESLRELREHLKLEDSFAIGLDLDNIDGTSTTGMDNFVKDNQKYLDQLGYVDFHPRKYTDFEDMSILLIVCQNSLNECLLRGKMGMTFPESLRYYDLRLRFPTESNLLRAPFEQDIGRSCRYVRKGDEDKLPTIILGGTFYQRFTTRRKVKRDGVCELMPDYKTYITLINTKNVEFPKRDSDLGVYQKSWKAGKDHFDLDNKSTCNQRFLLYGRPQIGKTGAYLHLFYLLWRHLGSPIKEESTETIQYMGYPESEEPEDDILEDDVLLYPDVSKWQSVLGKELEWPIPSFRGYGDPSCEKTRIWYWQHKKKCPFSWKNISISSPELEKRSNNLYCTNKNQESTRNEQGFKNLYPQIYTKNVSKAYSSECLKFKESSSHYMTNLHNLYNRFWIKNGQIDLGKLYCNKKLADIKWTKTGQLNEKLGKTKDGHPRIIIMPSTGRSKSGLLDLKKCMEDELYVHLLVIREDEIDDYLKACADYPQIDLFFYPNNKKAKTAGTARYWSKVIADIITKDGKLCESVLMMDDNIKCWQKVPLSQTEKKIMKTKGGPKHLEDVSLKQLFSYYFNKDFKDRSKIAMLGFTVSGRNLQGRKNSFLRSHVYAAVFMNLKAIYELSKQSKSSDFKFNYERDVWAMEDILFNHKLALNGGLLIKCMHFRCTKVYLKSGGVTACEEGIFMKPGNHISKDEEGISKEDFLKFLNEVRNVENPQELKRKLINLEDHLSPKRRKKD